MYFYGYDHYMQKHEIVVKIQYDNEVESIEATPIHEVLGASVFREKGGTKDQSSNAIGLRFYCFRQFYQL